MRKRVFMVLCCTFAFCLVLAGCSGGSTSTAASGTSATSASTASAASASADEAKAAFVGTWDIIEITNKGKTTSKLEIDAMKKNGQDFFATFDEDGTLTLVTGTGDNVVKGAWEAKSATEGTLAGSGGKSFKMNIEGDQLTIDLETAQAKLVKGEPRASLPEKKSAASSKSSAAQSASSAAKSKASSKYEASIDDISVGEDYQGNPALIVTYTWKNNSNDSRSFASSLHPRCYQNGVQLNSAFMMGIDSNGYLADVRPGYGTTFQMAYELKDTQNPVDVEVYELASYKGSPIATKTYKF